MKWTSGNQVELLSSGEAYFTKLISEIDSAHFEIFFEVYIFRSDEIGGKVAASLKAAARRGVKVRLIVDSVGSRTVVDSFFEDMRAAGIDVIVFRNFWRWIWHARVAIRRLHRKTVIFDGERAIVGGINIEDDQVNTDTGCGKLDAAVWVKGPIVRRIHAHSFRFYFWITRQWRAWIAYESAWRAQRPATSYKIQEPSVDCRYLIRDNVRHRRRLQKFYFDAIDSARSEILITSAYFVPHLRLRNRLRRAVRRGVSVTVFVQGSADEPIAYYASRPLFHSLVKSGVKIIECRTRVLHAKAAVIDQKWSTVGSFNWEPFSIFLNIEANIFIRDEFFAEHLSKILWDWIKTYGHALTKEDFNTSFSQRIQILWARFIYWIASLIGGYRFD